MSAKDESEKGAEASPIKENMSEDTSIDMRMRKSLGPLLEAPYSSEALDEIETLLKPPVPLEKNDSQTAADKNVIGSRMHQKQSDDTNTPSQVQIASGSFSMINKLMSLKLHPSKMPIPARGFQISRFPIHCPEVGCHAPLFVSDFCKHFQLDHSVIPTEHIKPQEIINFLLNIKLTRFGSTRTHMMYLIRDKVVGFGKGEFKDFLPILLRTAWINLLQLCEINENDQMNYIKNGSSIGEYLAIWLTGIVPEDQPLRVTLAACDGKEPVCHHVYSGEVHSVRCAQEVTEVLQKAKALLISAEEFKLLTNERGKLLELKIVVQ